MYTFGMMCVKLTLHEEFCYLVSSGLIQDLQEKGRGSLVMRKPTNRLLEMHHHLFFSMDHLLCSIGEDSELHFSFYDIREGRCFT